MVFIALFVQKLTLTPLVVEDAPAFRMLCLEILQFEIQKDKKKTPDHFVLLCSYKMILLMQT